MDKNQAEDDDNVDENYDPEAEVVGNWAVAKELPEIAVTTGEENDEIKSEFRAKLYRWRDN